MFVEPPNTLPVVDVDGVLNYIENGAAAAIDPTITITDTTDTHLESATVAITGNFAAGQDVLGFTNTSNVTGQLVGNTVTFKSVQPMAGRVALGEYDQLHHFIAAGVWDTGPVETELLVQLISSSAAAMRCW